MGDISDLREEYEGDALKKTHLEKEPIAQFRSWFNAAREAKLPEPNAMTLTTVDANAQPFARTVLLKAYDDHGFVFFTNYGSRKATHIAANPNVSLLFAWLPLQRQIMINGKAERIATTESLKYFASRPLGSRLGAWVSEQSATISSRKVLLAKLDEVKRKFKNGDIPLPSFWGGYRVKPESIELWQGGPNRLHDRFLYSKQSDQSWEISRLAP